MNHSPNSLRDFIRTENTDLGEIAVVEVNGNHYVTESSLVNFMNENDIDSRSQLIESLIDFNHINGLSVLDENTVDESLVFARDIMMLYESLNPMSVNSAAQGRSLLRMGIVQLVSIISNGKYTQINDIDRYIKKCDSMLEAIQEEKKNAKEKHTLKGQTQFSCMFLFNLCKTVLLSFVAPLAVAKHITWPAAVSKLFMKNGGKAISGFLSKRVIGGMTVKTLATAGTVGLDAAISMPPDIKGLYLSITDYIKLLDDYDREIRKTEQCLINQRKVLERKQKEEMNKK